MQAHGKHSHSCIMQNMLQYYMKHMPNVGPLKPIIMKLTYIGKVAFNINGTTIYSTLAIPLNKNYNELKALSDVNQIVTINEISLIGNRMLTFINCKLRDIKQTHNKFIGGLDVIMTSDFYQASPIWNSWIFKSRIDELNILGTMFWQENIKCYELK